MNKFISETPNIESKKPKVLLVRQKCDIVDLLKTTQTVPVIPTTSCLFPPHDFNKGPECWNVMFIYLNIKSNPNALAFCISSILKLLTLKTTVKTYSSSFLVESNGFGCITILINFSSKTAMIRPENFVFDNNIPTIHLVKRSRPVLDFLVANFRNNNIYTERYFLTSSNIVLQEFLSIP